MRKLRHNISNGKWYVCEKQMVYIGKLKWVVIDGPFKERAHAKEAMNAKEDTTR